MARLRTVLVALIAWAIIVLSPAQAHAQALENGLPAGIAREADIPPVCTLPPAPDAMTATAGVAPPCTPRADAAQQTQIPPAVAVTTSTGDFTGTWAVPLDNAPTKALATIYGTAVPYHCQVATLTTTVFTGKCWALVTTTMPAVPTALLGLVVSPVANPAAGLTVNVFARR